MLIGTDEMTFLAAISPSNNSIATTLSAVASLTVESLFKVTLGSSHSTLLIRCKKTGLLVTARD